MESWNGKVVKYLVHCSLLLMLWDRARLILECVRFSVLEMWLFQNYICICF